MYVCNCNAINEKTVKTQINKSGDNALCHLKKECGLGEGCGMCIKHVKLIMDANQKN